MVRAPSDEKLVARGGLLSAGSRFLLTFEMDCVSCVEDSVIGER